MSSCPIKKINVFTIEISINILGEWYKETFTIALKAAHETN